MVQLKLNEHKKTKLKTSKIYKTILSAFIFLASVMYTGGCSDSPLTNTTTIKKTYKARTERDFADKNFKAEPGAVIVLNLEDKNSPPDPEWFDTDIIGIDIVPIRYTETAKHHFRIDEESNFEMSLISDSSKQVLFELTPENMETDVMIPAGDYRMIIESLEIFGSDTLDEQTVFIQPDRETTGSANTDYDPAQLNTLISRKSCVNCDLSNAILPGANLSYANLWFANLNNAILTNANFQSADLNRANLRFARAFSANLRNAYLNGAILQNANLSGSNLSNANLSNADLRDADLEDANLANANLSNANLRGASLYEARLDGSNLSNANLSYANLQIADLRRANLSNANLYRASLRNANLSNANLNNANLTDANLTSANFCGADKIGIIAPGVITNSQTQCWP